jgi:uncharacterized protein YkwD
MSLRPRVTLYKIAATGILAAAGLIAPAPSSATSFSAQVIALTNAQRHSIMGDGCPALVPNRALSRAASGHAADMARRNYFGHTSLNGATSLRRIRWAGYRPRRFAENIAAGQGTPEDVVRVWMDSPGHRANILDCSLREIGVGFASNPRARFNQYWVQDFGSR